MINRIRNYLAAHEVKVSEEILSTICNLIGNFPVEDIKAELRELIIKYRRTGRFSLKPLDVYRNYEFLNYSFGYQTNIKQVRLLSK